MQQVSGSVIFSGDMQLLSSTVPLKIRRFIPKLHLETRGKKVKKEMKFTMVPFGLKDGIDKIYVLY